MTDKIKSIFFAQYLGQKVFSHKDWIDFNDKSPNELDPIYLQCGSNRLSDGFLLLRSIEQLTDEELKICCDAYYKDGRTIDSVEYVRKCFILAYDGGNKTPIVIFQLLLRLGILLPFTYLSEDNQPKTLTPTEIVNLGWAKITH